MPHVVVSKKQLSADVFVADIEAPLVARAGKPGQFVIICISSDYSERIPLIYKKKKEQINETFYHHINHIYSINI